LTGVQCFVETLLHVMLLLQSTLFEFNHETYLF